MFWSPQRQFDKSTADMGSPDASNCLAKLRSILPSAADDPSESCMARILTLTDEMETDLDVEKASPAMCCNLALDNGDRTWKCLAHDADSGDSGVCDDSDDWEANRCCRKQ